MNQLNGSELRDRRKKLGLTQVELSEEMGVTQQALSHWERGIYPVPMSIQKLLRYIEASHANRSG
jgi:transcriptional regulator with XRE-family HTH domain